MNESDPTQAIAARFAHELAGPVGASIHALELMEIQTLTLFEGLERELWKAGVEADGVTGGKAPAARKGLSEALARRLGQAVAKNAKVAELLKGAGEKKIERLLRIFEIAYSYRCARMGLEGARGVMRNLRSWNSDEGLEEGVSLAQTLRMAWTVASMENEGLSVTWQLDELPFVRANPHALMQVWMNILRNAAQVNGGGCRVNIATRETPVSLVVEIMNDGAPLPKGVKLFEKGASARKGGTGLGLHLCREVVTAHGGKIAAENCKSGGVVFRVELPKK